MSLDKQKIKEALEKEKNILLDELKDIGRLNPETGEWEAMPEKDLETESDQNDLADKFEEFELRSSTLDVLEKRLKNILHALKKIDTQEFGICEISGQPIEEDRLLANPAARTCKEHLETEDKLFN